MLVQKAAEDKTFYEVSWAIKGATLSMSQKCLIHADQAKVAFMPQLAPHVPTHIHILPTSTAFKSNTCDIPGKILLQATVSRAYTSHHPPKSVPHDIAVLVISDVNF